MYIFIDLDKDTFENYLKEYGRSKLFASKQQ